MSTRARAADQPLAAAPTSSVPHVDRSGRPWVPFYLDLLTRQLPEGKPGPNLAPGPAALYSLIISRQGTPQLGRRPSTAEREGRETFRPNPITSTEILRRYNVSHDQLQNWEAALETPRPCAACDRAHPLLRVVRRIGFAKRYELLQCSDVRPSEVVPIARAVRAKRPKTGGALIDRGMPLFSPDGEVSDKVRGSADQLAAPSGVSEKARALALGDGEGGPPSVVEARLIALVAITALEGVTVPPDTLSALAHAIDTTDVAEIRDLLLYVTVAAGVRHAALTPAFAVAALEERATLSAAAPAAAAEQTGEPLRVLDGNRESPFLERALARVLELARQAEPQTTLAIARRYRDEVITAVKQRFGQRVPDSPEPFELEDDVLEREVFRIFSDPRVVGRPGDRTHKPIALIRDGLKHGWIWTDPERDTGSHRLTRAFRKLAPGVQAAVLAIFEEHHATGAPLPRQRLLQLGISSTSMIQHLTELTRPPR
jgi:hypothetical protein